MEKQKIRNIRREIARLIDSIKDHSDNIGDRDRIPQLELELILNKIEKLYERSVIFNYLHQQMQMQEDHRIEQEEQVTKPETPATSVSEKVVPETQNAEIPAISTGNVEVEEDPGPVTQNPEIRPAKTDVIPDRQTVKPAGGDSSVHSKISQQQDRSLGAKLSMTPVPDLVRAIGINQRFTFIQELFNNDSKIFAESVKHLNNLPGMKEAEEFIHGTLVPQLKWDVEENTTVQEFITLVQRRFLT